MVSNLTAPKHTGYVRGLYSLSSLDPDVANRIESLVMGRIDHNAAIAQQYILRDDITSLSPLVRQAWARFIVGLLIRSPTAINNVLEEMLNPSDRDRKRLSKILAPHGQRYEDIREEDMKRFALLTVAKLTQNKPIEEKINTMRWAVYDPGLPELRFVTSDRPVIMTNGIGRKGGHLAIPISPHKLFLAFADAEIEAEIKKKSPWEMVDTVNQVVVRCAVEMAWDTTATRLPFMHSSLSNDAAADRNLFKTQRRRNGRKKSY